MNLLEFAGVAVGGIVGCYTLARLIFVAYFISKQQHERTKNHGTQQKS
jgi:hypothetical protein